jgi:Uma2 family endonuclease
MLGDMTDLAARHHLLTLDDYFRLEAAAVDVKHEYVAGQVYAMSGASRRHNRIAGNIFARLWTAARGGPCRVYMSDVKLRAAHDVVYYPDVMVACGAEGTDPLVEDAPCLVVEVLSPSTQLTDRREKALVYRQLASLRAYVIVDQARRWVHRY